MGLDNRDYLRDEANRYGDGGGTFGGGGRGSFGAQTPMCRKILIATIVVFLAQLFSVRGWTQPELRVERDQLVGRLQEALDHVKENLTVRSDDAGQLSETAQYYKEQELPLTLMIEKLQGPEPLTPQMLRLPKEISVVQDWLQLETPKVFSGQIWRLITCAFCHDRDSLGHIIFNMYLMWIFGSRLESMMGSKEFLLFYGISAVAASVCYMLIDVLTGTPIPMIGASGAVMALITLFAVYFPTQVIYIFFVIPIQMRWVAIFYALYDLHPLLQQAAGDVPTDNTAHAAHLGGMAFGYLYGTKKFQLKGHLSGIETWWKIRRRGFRVVGTEPSPVSRKTQELSDAMDAILRKISEQGEDSLTTAERKTLERASRELRDRRP